MKKIKYISFIILTFLIKADPLYASQTISNGTYTIKSIINNNKVLDVSGGNSANGTNIQLYESNNTNAQKWTITYESDGYYTISSNLSLNKVLDIQLGSIKSSSNIQLYEKNNTDAQKWSIIHIGNSYFEIRNKNQNYCIDIKGGKTNNNTNIQLYKCNNSNAQRFKIIQEITPSKTIEDGIYTISSSKDENKVLDVSGGKITNNTNIQLYSSNNTSAQKWYIKNIDNGYYSIASKLSTKKCMDISGGKSISGNNIQLYDCNETDAQKWIIKENEDKSYSIFTKKDPIPLDISGGKLINGTNIQIYYNNETEAQKFKLKKIEEKEIDDGIYTIKTKVDLNKVLDVSGGNSLDKTNVQLYESNNTNAQKWFVQKQKNGYYVIKSGLNSNLYLGINNSNIELTTSQTEWKIDYQSSDEFKIISKDSSKNINVENSNGNNSTNINLSNDNQTNRQIFIFEPTNINENTKTFNNGYYTITSKLNNDKVLDIEGAKKFNNTNIQLYDSNNTKAQIWYFKFKDNGYYTITSSINTNTSMDLKSGNTVTGTNIQLYRYNGSNAQLWKLIDDGYGHISIYPKANDNLCINIENNITENGTNIQAETCSNSDSQKFKLIRNTSKKIYKGADISQYQKGINWETLSKNVDFLILRAGYGDNWSSQDDKLFFENVENCNKYNIPYGVYLYSYAKKVQKDNNDGNLNYDAESAVSEAAHVKRLLNSVSYKPNLKTSVYLDIEEEKLAYLGKTLQTDIANKFCNIIESSGYGCSVYANLNWLKNHINTNSLTTKDRIWVANWLSPSPKDFTKALTSAPNYNLSNYKLWQFSDDGRINGYNYAIDLDLGYDIFD